MIPINSPVSRAVTYYISLYINYSSIYNLKESTSYFPINNYLSTINDNYLEIQARGLTSDLTPYDENEVPLFSDLSIGATSPLDGAHSLTIDSEWGN